MTDLKKLLIEFDTLTQKNRGLSLSKQIDLLESTLSNKFSVTLRGDDSSADNKVNIICDYDLKSKFKDIVADTICRLTEDDFRCLRGSDTFKLFETKLDKLITDHQLKFLNGGLLELFESVDVIATRFATKVKFDGARETYHHLEFETELSKLFKEFVNEIVDEKPKTNLC